MDESKYFDSNIERAVGLMTTLSQSRNKKTDNIEMLTGILPLLEPQLSERIAPFIKAINVNKILQSYISLSRQNTHIKESRREILASLRGELDPHGQKILELFVKFNEIKDIMEVI